MECLGEWSGDVDVREGSGEGGKWRRKCMDWKMVEWEEEIE